MKDILNRTCCRIFDSSRTISKKDLTRIIKAGQAAPSAKNRQPYFFLVILNPECRKEIAKAAIQGRKKQFSHLSEEDFKSVEKGDTGSNDASIANASVAILVFRNSEAGYTEAETESESLNIKEEQGVATAAYSMMLQAHAMGIASGWVCSPLYIKNELKKILPKHGVNFNDNWEPRLIIPLGYPMRKTQKPPRKPLEDICLFVE